MISREAFAAGDRPRDLYVIGSMGLASSLALGMALSQPGTRVFAVDGDGSALMSLGSLAMIAREAPANLVHVALDNQVYGSTGNQPSLSDAVELERVAEATGYRWRRRVATIRELDQALAELAGGAPGPAFLLVRVSASEVPGIGRITVEPEEMAARLRATHLPPA
jgi:thiamine pyrophosphate-dependent acetolactate synthase large subunit-like protein